MPVGGDPGRGDVRRGQLEGTHPRQCGGGRHGRARQHPGSFGRGLTCSPHRLTSRQPEGVAGPGTGQCHDPVHTQPRLARQIGDRPEHPDPATGLHQVRCRL